MFVNEEITPLKNMIYEENEETTSQKSIEEEVFEKEISEESEEKETSKQNPTEEVASEDIEQKNKMLKARISKENKRLYESLKKIEHKRKEIEQTDILGITKTIAALKSYSSKELDYIALISKAKNISLNQAAETEEVKLFIPAYRDKVKNTSKSLEPSTKMAPSSGKKNVWDMNKKDFQAYQNKVRFIK